MCKSSCSQERESNISQKRCVRSVGGIRGLALKDKVINTISLWQLDALVPAVEALEDSKAHDLRTVLKAMATAADEGAKRTLNMKPR